MSDTGGRVPPNDSAAEGVVISSVLLEPECIDEVREVCDENAFFSRANKLIFSTALKLHEEGSPIDMVSVRGRLERDGRLAEVGGSAYLVQVTQATPAITNVVEHARTIQDLGRVRRAIQEMSMFTAKGYGTLNDPKNQFDDRQRVQKYFGEALQSLSDIAYERQTENLRPIKEIITEVGQVITAATQANSSVTGTPTGFDQLDKALTGLHSGDVTIIAARPGMGKTALGLSMMKKMAAQGYAVAFFSLEMPAVQLTMRLLSQETNIDLNELRSGRFDAADWPKITTAMQRLSALPIFIDDTPALNVLDIRGRARVLQRSIAAGKHPECTSGKLGAIFIDYLQLMSSINKRHNREEEVSQTSQAIKRVAKELDVPVVALSQLNREPEKRKDHRPELSDLRESGSLEQDADNVLFVFRPGYYETDEPDLKRIAEIIIAKQRNGPTLTVKTVFLPETARFENFSDDNDPGVYDPRDSREDDDYGIPNELEF